jgi:hypothetical protein
MIKVISVALPVTLIVLALIKKESKILTILLLLLTYILFAFEQSDGDYMYYLIFFEQIGVGQGAGMEYEPLYVFSCKMANEFGMSFFHLRAIISVIEVLILFFVAKRFTSKTAFVLALFFIFPALFDAELFRWLFGICIVIFGMQYLIRSKSFYDYLRYFICVVIASYYHSGCWFFLIYYLVLIPNHKLLLQLVDRKSVV